MFVVRGLASFSGPKSAAAVNVSRLIVAEQAIQFFGAEALDGPLSVVVVAAVVRFSSFLGFATVLLNKYLQGGGF
jgi:hypothetical protein